MTAVRRYVVHQTRHYVPGRGWVMEPVVLEAWTVMERLRAERLGRTHGLSGGGASRGPEDVLGAEAAPVACRPATRPRSSGTRGRSYGGRS